MRFPPSTIRLLASAACAAALLAQRESTHRNDSPASARVGKPRGSAALHRAAFRAAGEEKSALASQARDLAAAPASAIHVDTLREILLALAEEDPRFAMELACAASLRMANDTPLAAVIAARLAERDPAAALLLVRGLDERTATGQAAYAAVFDAMSEHGDFADALQVVRSVCATETHAGFMQRIVLEWAATSPAAALGWIRDVPDTALRDRLLIEAGQNRFALDPAQAAELTLQVRDPALRVASLTETLLGWFDADPAAATRWLDRFPPHVDLDYFAARIATLPALAASRIDVALSWAESIVQPELRLEALTTLIGTWGQQDAAAAVHYVSNATSLTALQKNALLACVRNASAPALKE